MHRILFIVTLFLSISLFAQRDSIIGSINCHLISDSSDTGTSWIQQKIKRKSGEQFNGVYFEIYPDGKLKAKGYYKRGKRNEKWIRYYPSGQKSVEGYFDVGYKSDLWMEYYPSGQISWKGNFYKNMPSGFWRYFYENGIQKSMTRYLIKTSRVMGKATATAKGRSFKSNMETHYTISPADSLVEYYPDGKLKIRILYGHKGGLNGACDFYYANGVKSFHGQYLEGKEVGDWFYYCPDGKLFKFTRFTSVANQADVRIETDENCDVATIEPEMIWKTQTFPPIE
ncbi:MAG: hypothetical protein NT084_09145 [Bacteroidetes bacterium]|nr:hypothetical protein [Bacteroidota bacterium]